MFERGDELIVVVPLASETLIAIGAILLYFLVMFLLGVGVTMALAIIAGVAGALAAVPVLSVLPDVRKSIDRIVTPPASQNGPLWRLAIRLRYLGLGVGFGIGYLFVFITVVVPFEELGLVGRNLGPVPSLVLIPIAYLIVLIPVVMTSSVVPKTDESNARLPVAVQWSCFLSVAVGAASMTPLAAIWLLGRIAL